MIILDDAGHGALHQEGVGSRYATYVDYGQGFQVYFGEPEGEEIRVELVANEKPKLELYMRPSCYYCKKVTDYLKSVGKTIPMKDTGQDRKAAEELVRLGGKRQVPCLFINGEPLYESDAIIEWLKANKHLY